MISFCNNGPATRHAIAASFDLSGFSTFCQRHDAQAYVTRFLSALFKEFDLIFKDGIRDFFRDTSKMVQVPRPDFIKFTGDGALMLWLRDNGEDFPAEFCTSAVLALREFQQKVPEFANRCEREWRTTGLPRTVRVGIATGRVQPLIGPDDAVSPDVIDYAGYCINLAVRLQDHCPDVGFIVHQPLAPEIDGLLSMKAIGMKGTLVEPVLIYLKDYQRLCGVNKNACDRWFQRAE